MLPPSAHTEASGTTAGSMIGFGGTCDVSIAELGAPVQDGPIPARLLATSRYHRLGGGDLDDALTYALGAGSLLEGPEHPRAEDANFLTLNAYFTSIGGGTDQIQRNIIGERVLGLPKEPEVDRDVPFRQVRGG